MNKNLLSPYIRAAMHSTLTAPFLINERIIFDYEIIFVQKGECSITIDQKEYTCKKNDVVFLRPGVPHKFESIGSVDFYQPHIHFDAVYGKKSEETPVSFKLRDEMSEYERTLIQEDIFADVPIPDVFTPTDLEGFKKTFFEIIRIYQDKPFNYEILYKKQLLGLMDMLLQQFDSKKSSNHSDISPDIINAVKSYIDSNYCSRITLDFLAKQFYLNKFTLIRRFKARYKSNVMEYYYSKRIDYAKKMLSSTEFSIYGISEQLDFPDIYSFSRFFKNHTGISPTEYRKNHFRR